MYLPSMKTIAMFSKYPFFLKSLSFMVPFSLKLGHFSKMIMYTDLLRHFTITITTTKQQQKPIRPFLIDASVC